MDFLISLNKMIKDQKQVIKQEETEIDESTDYTHVLFQKRCIAELKAELRAYERVKSHYKVFKTSQINN